MMLGGEELRQMRVAQLGLLRHIMGTIQASLAPQVALTLLSSSSGQVSNASLALYSHLTRHDLGDEELRQLGIAKLELWLCILGGVQASVASKAVLDHPSAALLR